MLNAKIIDEYFVRSYDREVADAPDGCLLQFHTINGKRVVFLAPSLCFEESLLQGGGDHLRNFFELSPSIIDFIDLPLAGISIYDKSYLYDNALRNAIRRRKWDEAEVLVEFGADLDIILPDGETPREFLITQTGCDEECARIESLATTYIKENANRQTTIPDWLINKKKLSRPSKWQGIERRVRSIEDLVREAYGNNGGTL